MPVHDINCKECGESEEFKFSVMDDVAAILLNKPCKKCNSVGFSIDFSAVKQGKPVIKFVEGVYQIGTQLGGKHYSTEREMRKDAEKHGLTIARG